LKKIHINNDDNYATPPNLYAEWDKEFRFDFDPCPFNTGEIILDGLKINWGQHNYINPPYSDLVATGKLKSSFVKKAIEESKKGKLCVLLLPVSTSTKLFHDFIKPNAADIRFIKGRIKFGKLDKDGKFYIPLNKKGKTQTGTKDSMLVIFDGRL
jgi:site-specific DNA-methyltransferase (adenine-specific)